MRLTDEDLEILLASGQRAKIEDVRGYYRVVPMGEIASELLQLREQVRWIPVSEKLPEDFDDVIVTGNGLLAEAYYHAPCWCGSDGLCPPFEVTHWMPFPPVPEVE